MPNISPSFVLQFNSQLLQPQAGILHHRGVSHQAHASRRLRIAFVNRRLRSITHLFVSLQSFELSRCFSAVIVTYRH